LFQSGGTFFPTQHHQFGIEEPRLRAAFCHIAPLQ
jgi:hypothetical protein